MKAMLIHSAPKGKVTVEKVPDPACSDNGIVLKVGANGICRTDWHMWNGDWGWVGLVPYKWPAIAGHEGCGEIVEVGKNVKKWKKGDKVIAPVVLGCGECPRCLNNVSSMCMKLRVVGYSFDGLYAEYCAVPDADFNMFKLPEGMDYASAASIGCRFQTAWHAVVSQGEVSAGDTVAIWGAGGLGDSAIHIASKLGARVIAVDIKDESLELAKKVGAHDVVNAKKTNPVQAVKDLTGGGANLSIDCLGIAETCLNSVMCLTNRGKHVQVGLTDSVDKGMVTLPTDLMLCLELQWRGSLAMPSNEFCRMLNHIASSGLTPGALVTRKIKLEEAPEVLQSMTDFKTVGINTVVF